MIINGANLAVAWQQHQALFKESLANVGTPAWTLAAMQTTSTGSQETYHFLDELPAVEEWVGPRAIHQLRANSFTLVNKRWSSAIAVAREEYEDERWEMIRARVVEMARSFMFHPDELLGALIMASETDTCFDGQPFLSNAHPTAAGTQDNLSDGAFSRARFEAGYAAMLGFTDYWGKPLRLKPTHVIGGPTNFVEMRNVLEMDTIFEATFSGKNPNFKLCTPIYCPDITDNSWWMVDLSRGPKPVVYQSRMPVELTAQDQPDNDCVVEDDEYRYFGRARYAMGYGLWQCAYGYSA